MIITIIDGSFIFKNNYIDLLFIRLFCMHYHIYIYGYLVKYIKI